MVTNQRFDFAKLEFKKFAIQHETTNFAGDAACHKIELKKSKKVNIGESKQKYGISLSKVETFFCQKGI